MSDAKPLTDEEIEAIRNALLAERDRLLDALPCPAHGRCVPHALEQIAALKSALNAANEKRRRLSGKRGLRVEVKA